MYLLSWQSRGRRREVSYHSRNEGGWIESLASLLGWPESTRSLAGEQRPRLPGQSSQTHNLPLAEGTPGCLGNGPADLAGPRVENRAGLGGSSRICCGRSVGVSGFCPAGRPRPPSHSVGLCAPTHGSCPFCSSVRRGKWGPRSQRNRVPDLSGH